MEKAETGSLFPALYYHFQPAYAIIVRHLNTGFFLALRMLASGTTQ